MLENKLASLNESIAVISDSNRCRLLNDILRFPVTLAERRSIIDALIKRIEINDDDIFITWKFG